LNYLVASYLCGFSTIFFSHATVFWEFFISSTLTL
jgi:hypothetical protein